MSYLAFWNVLRHGYAHPHIYSTEEHKSLIKILHPWNCGILSWSLDETSSHMDYIGPEKKSGKSFFAFVCREGVVVAADCSAPDCSGETIQSSASSDNFIKFNDHVFGYVNGDLKSCNFVLEASKDALGDKSDHDIAELFAKKVASDPSAPNDLSGILVAGWDNKDGPVLYCVDGAEGKLYQGVLFFLDSCPKRPYFYHWNFVDMSLEVAAKAARCFLAYAIALANVGDGRTDDTIGMEVEGTDDTIDISPSVKVFRVGRSTGGGYALGEATNKDIGGAGTGTSDEDKGEGGECKKGKPFIIKVDETDPNFRYWVITGKYPKAWTGTSEED